MAEVVVINLPAGADILGVPNVQTEVLTQELTEVVVVVDTGKGDPGPVGPMGPPGDSVVPFSLDYAVEPRVGSQSYRFAFDATLAGVSACLRVAGTGSDLVLDINIDGVSIFTDQNDRPRILDGTDDLPEIALNVPIVSGNRLSVDVDDIGSTFGGEDLSVFIRFERV